MFKPWKSWEPFPSPLSQGVVLDNAALKLPYLLAHSLIEMFLSIL
jgi:hypothetical protein